MLLNSWRTQFHFWVERRIPAARRIMLGHRNIFIIPNQQGFGFLLVLGLMLVGAANYEVSLAFALVYLLLSVFVLTIFYTFRNLAGLYVSAVAGNSVFAGEKAAMTLILKREGERVYENIQLSFAGGRAVTADLVEEHEQRLTVYAACVQRGYFNPGRLVVATIFPFGICRAWSLLDLNLRCLVYPRPIACDLQSLLSNQQNSGATKITRGTDDFHSLRVYQNGDSLKHVAWKIFARGQGLHTKEYASQQDENLWLRWTMFEGLQTEERLSRLCWCVLQLEAAGLDYGLEIPGSLLVPGNGPQHSHRALQALALFGLATETQA